MRLEGVDDAQRLRDFAANLFFWQGLRWVPLGCALLVAGASWSGWWPLPGWTREYAALTGVLAALPITIWIGAYYRRTYGTTQTLPGLYARRSALKWLVVYPAMFAALLIDNLLEPPVLVSGFAFGVAIVAYVRSTGGGRVHYWAAAALLVATSVASAFGLAPTGREATALVFILLGAIYVVGGVLDHFELRHRLKAAPQG